MPSASTTPTTISSFIRRIDRIFWAASVPATVWAWAQRLDKPFQCEFFPDSQQLFPQSVTRHGALTPSVINRAKRNRSIGVFQGFEFEGLSDPGETVLHQQAFQDLRWRAGQRALGVLFVLVVSFHFCV